MAFSSTIATAAPPGLKIPCWISTTTNEPAVPVTEAVTVDPGSSSGYDPMTSCDGPEMLDSPSTSSFYYNPTSHDAPMRSSSPLSTAVSYATQSAARRRTRPAPSSASNWASSSAKSTAGAHGQRVYKSRSSARRPTSPMTPNAPASNPNSSSSSSLRLVHANSRPMAVAAARPSSISNKYPRDLSLGRPENPFAPGAYALGAMRNGEWEEWTDEEDREMAMEQRRDAWQRKRVLELQAVELLRAVEEEFEDGEDDFDRDLEQQPPEDLLDLYNASLIDMSRSIPRLPSLASDPGLSTEEEEGNQMSNDDLEMHESPEDALSPTPPFLDPSRALQLFSEILSTSSCPKCQRSEPGTIQGHNQQGARCIHCDWSVSISALEASSLEFAAHTPSSSQPQHVPIFAWDVHTETLVLCSGCDESFAA
ncbi:BQ2448_2379 [Microbotryum intermedium]|uniref:BQ2448_2379 protein n=1 Tax=Microbotryum intermedium TaxID=269621 RepID=A0A238F9C8_9BASI|nr:BQ2448_2379 [Microbotryum intermedium]